jgi:hypothetical protein
MEVAMKVVRAMKMFDMAICPMETLLQMEY